MKPGEFALRRFPLKKADDHEDESDTSTLVGGEDIDKKTTAVVKK